MRQVAVVTGGTGALGRWVVRELVARGWRVHVPWKVAAEVGALEALLEDGAGSVVTGEVDVTDAAEVEARLAALKAAT
ncbi:MAG: SDR family NAD(P)-dependent oxidoreductase [Gemmatimonadetes bacterium]|nr:SDR family NAD(P)-dependent oxidoreductase [Gemmatimonadota bacterium]